jgi:DNA (cytosine-5)-methyltransferase 3A
MQGGHRQPKIAIVPEATKRGYVEIFPNEGVDLSYPKSATRRGRRMEDKSNALQASQQDLNWYNGFTYRKLTVVECERLQTLNDNYTEGVSNTQRYKMIGNGWTVEVIAHIFRNIKVAQPLNT